MSNLYTIKTKSGKEYKRYAWTGGNVPERIYMQIPEYRELYDAFLQDQLTDYGSHPDIDTIHIFMNRAELDAWRTYSENVLKPRTAVKLKNEPSVTHRDV